MCENANSGVQDQVAPGTDYSLAIPMHSGVGLKIKRFIDIVGSLLMLACIAPFVPIIILAIEIDSPGPIFFRPRIIGYRGREFWTYKFRTMHPDAFTRLLNDPELLAQYKQNLKLINDPRITRVGRILRKTSLDEIPQLWSVLKGDLSLVGPRMLAKLELDNFGPYRDKILSVKPGLAGLCVASGRQSLREAMRKAGLRELNFRFEFEGCKVVVDFVSPTDAWPTYIG
jgi:lipopolysaccharide/colanic/teichoic acid biosynthesis glycosyltransferase